MSYMDQLGAVAQSFATSNLDYLMAQMTSSWEAIERRASHRHYDVFDTSGDGSYRPAMVSEIRRLVSCLYHIPAADPALDVLTITEKDREYGGSWCTRGGTGAFHVAVRKWDRIVNQVTRHGGSLREALELDTRAEGIVDDLSDLRCYLLLWLAWIEDDEIRLKSERVLTVPERNRLHDILGDDPRFR